MKVKDIVLDACRLINRTDAAAWLKNPANYPDAEQTELLSVLLYCFNAAQDELARNYLPLTKVQKLESDDGKYYYASFDETPVRIKKITRNGERKDFKIYAEYVQSVSGEIEAEYEYTPSQKGLDGESEYSGGASGYMIALGMAAEYCLINGQAESYEKFEELYRRQIDAAQAALPKGDFIPPRRWV